MSKGKFTFKKAEKLTSKIGIERLFKSDSIFTYPYKVFYFYSEDNTQELPKTLISVSKRKFKKAVDRNTIKRRIREAYRLNKTILEKNSRQSQLIFGLIYVGKQSYDFHFLEKKLILVLQRLAEEQSLSN